MKSPVFVSLICLGIVILMVLFLMMPSLEEPRGVARQRQSKINLKMIGLAMHNYHHMHGMLPPGKIVTQDGDDYHGWPALSLPFLDSAPIYNSINFDQPFDTPDNQSVMQVPYRWFQNPMLTEQQLPADSLHYAMNSRVFPANKSLQFRDVTDGLSNTLMGGEIADGFSPWSRPGHTRDPALGLNKGPLTFGSPYFGQKNYSGVQMLLMDGSVRTISDDIDPAILKALATPDAGDDLKGYVP